MRSAGDAAASSVLGQRSSFRPRVPQRREKEGKVPSVGSGRSPPGIVLLQGRTEAGDADVRGAERPAAVASGDSASLGGLRVALWSRSAPSGPRVERRGDAGDARHPAPLCRYLTAAERCGCYWWRSRARCLV